VDNARPLSAPRSARERVRAELVSEIKAVARRHLGEHGASGLSLRAVSRELGMVSSAVYRYFPSRDDLLTALIIDAYDEVGAATEAADRSVPATDLAGRWLAACRAFRAWARAEPQQYALVYGSPVPGYRVPPDTIGPAARVGLVFLGQMADAIRAGHAPAGVAELRVPVLDPQMRAGLVEFDPPLPEPLVSAGVVAWVHLIGVVTAELFGHLHNVIADHDAFFDAQMSALYRVLGLAPAGT
jgi:AcrR family transcriptional regulator